MNINTLHGLTITELIILGNSLGLIIPLFCNKEYILLKIIFYFFYYKKKVLATGIIDIFKEGYGFIRYKDNSYLPSKTDIYVSPMQIKLYNLRIGDTILCKIRLPNKIERYFTLVKIFYINYENPLLIKKKILFKYLTPLHSNYRFKMIINHNYSINKIIKNKKKNNNINKKNKITNTVIKSIYYKENNKNNIINTNLIGKILDLTICIGKGQRGLIIAPPKVGKTVLLQHIAKSISYNNPTCSLIILLIDERPEEVTEMRNLINNIGGEVISSTFDEPAFKHIQISELILEKAKRLVENKKDVIILLDSLTRLSRAYNILTPNSGKILTGGIDSNALYKPKNFFGAARNIKEGGSLTIIATILIDTGSKMDQVIFEEFKGTGNMEIYLSKKIAEKRLFPAINYKLTGSRREELLISSYELKKMWKLRQKFNNMNEIEIIEFLIKKLKKNNIDLLKIVL